MSAPAPTDRLAGRYLLDERIATGGMGVVWRARDGTLGRDVAIKLIRSEYADDSTFRARLRAEARAIAAIHDPHVVRVFDVCEELDPAGGFRSFLVMELVDGESLAVRLARGPLSADATAALVAQVADALAAAHARGIVHRDIKPANLMVDASGHVTLLDFGIARAADAVALTATNMLLGTARYLAPEQVAGDAASQATDVYSLGVVGYECLVGSAPFDRSSDVATALAHAHDPTPPLPASVPAALADLVCRMLDKDPAGRPDATAVAAAARARPPHRPDAGTAELPRATKAFATTPDGIRPRRSSWLRPVPLVGAGVVAVAAVALAIVIAGHSGQPSGQPGAKLVNVKANRYVGETWTRAASQLRGLGLHPHRHNVPGHTAGAVASLSRSGRLASGSAITVSVGTGPAATPTPSQPGPVTPAPPAKHHGPKPHPGHGNGHGPGSGPGHGDD